MANRLVNIYGSQIKFDHWLEKTTVYWQGKLANLAFQTNDRQFDLWLTMGKLTTYPAPNVRQFLLALS